ncbi:MAG: hypothetical protein GY795_09445 [Desulfobacterales bacterium]|nr:hypothetical protein [Desulfobacterales bacterium]
MSKKMKIVSFFAIALFIVSIGAVASADMVTLKAKVPKGKTLNAYTFVIPYTGKLVKTEKLGMTTFIKDQGDSLRVNGLDLAGIKGGKTAKIMKVKIEKGSLDLKNIAIESCGASSSDTFEVEFSR